MNNNFFKPAEDLTPPKESLDDQITNFDNLINKAIEKEDIEALKQHYKTLHKFILDSAFTLPAEEKYLLMTLESKAQAYITKLEIKAAMPSFKL